MQSLRGPWAFREVWAGSCRPVTELLRGQGWGYSWVLLTGGTAGTVRAVDWEERDAVGPWGKPGVRAQGQEKGGAREEWRPGRATAGARQ